MQTFIKQELWFGLVLAVLLAAYWILYGFTFAKIHKPCLACINEITKDLQLHGVSDLSSLKFRGEPVVAKQNEQVELWHNGDVSLGFAARLKDKSFLTPASLINPHTFVRIRAPTFGFSS